MVKRLEKLQRDFLWGGGSLERKIHLINRGVVCIQKEKGGLGIRKIGLLNKALLGKWIWRFAFEKNVLWKKVIRVKHGLEGRGWRSKEVHGPFGVGVWKEILKETSWCWDNMEFRVGRGTKVMFWIDHWCDNAALSQAFPQLYALAVCNNATVNEVWDPSLGQGGWNLRLSRDSNDWELVLIEELLLLLRDFRLSSEEDLVLWKGGGLDIFRIWVAYNLLAAPNPHVFPKKAFGWTRSQPKLLSLRGRLLGKKSSRWIGCKSEGGSSLIVVFCGCEEENVNHILLHCIVVRALWEIVFALFGVQWVFPEKVKAALFCWRGPFVGKKRKNIWNSILLCIFWTVWKERNRLTFRGGSLAI